MSKILKTGDFLLEMKKDIGDKLRRALEYMYWCGERYIEDFSEEKTFLKINGVGQGTYREFLHVWEKYTIKKREETKYSLKKIA